MDPIPPIAAAVEGLKASPACLAVVVLAALMTGLTFWGLQRDADRRAQAIQTLMDKCFQNDATPGRIKDKSQGAIAPSRPKL